MFDRSLLKIKRDSKYNFDKSSYLRLDANERVIPFSKKDLNFIKKKIYDSEIQSYPSYRLPVVKIISKKEKVKADQISITPGADTVLKYVFEAVVTHLRHFLTHSPTHAFLLKMKTCLNDVNKHTISTNLRHFF